MRAWCSELVVVNAAPVASISFITVTLEDADTLSRRAHARVGLLVGEEPTEFVADGDEHAGPAATVAPPASA